MRAVRSGAPTTVPVEDLLLLLANAFSEDSIVMKSFMGLLMSSFTLRILFETKEDGQLKFKKCKCIYLF